MGWNQTGFDLFPWKESPRPTSSTILDVSWVRFTKVSENSLENIEQGLPKVRIPDNTLTTFLQIRKMFFLMGEQCPPFNHWTGRTGKIFLLVCFWKNKTKKGIACSPCSHRCTTCCKIPYMSYFYILSIEQTCFSKIMRELIIPGMNPFCPWVSATNINHNSGSSLCIVGVTMVSETPSFKSLAWLPIFPILVDTP